MTQTATLPRDTNGYAPPARHRGCDVDNCPTCQGIGWILCDHQDAPLEQDPGNPDGHTEWCGRCDAPTDGRTWTWCPARRG